MALFKKDRPRDAGRPEAERGREAPRAPDRPLERVEVREGTSMAASSSVSTSREAAGGESAFLGQGTRVAGKISFDGPARIEGQIEGEVVASASLEIGEPALLNAQVTGETIVIRGKVTGDISASRKLEIRAPGKLFGNVTTPSLVIEEGVVFEGHCSMGASGDRTERKVTLLAKEEKAPPQAPAARTAQAETK